MSDQITSITPEKARSQVARTTEHVPVSAGPTAKVRRSAFSALWRQTGPKVFSRAIIADAPIDFLVKLRNEILMELDQRAGLLPRDKPRTPRPPPSGESRAVRRAPLGQVYATKVQQEQMEAEKALELRIKRQIFDLPSNRMLGVDFKNWLDRGAVLPNSVQALPDCEVFTLSDSRGLQIIEKSAPTSLRLNNAPKLIERKIAPSARDVSQLLRSSSARNVVHIRPAVPLFKEQDIMKQLSITHNKLRLVPMAGDFVDLGQPVGKVYFTYTEQLAPQGCEFVPMFSGDPKIRCPLDSFLQEAPDFEDTVSSTVLAPNYYPTSKGYAILKREGKLVH